MTDGGRHPPHTQTVASSRLESHALPQQIPPVKIAHRVLRVTVVVDVLKAEVELRWLEVCGRKGPTTNPKPVLSVTPRAWPYRLKNSSTSRI